MRPAIALVVGTAALTPSFGCIEAAAELAPTLALGVDRSAAPADGLTRVELSVESSAPGDGVVALELDGAGLLSSTHVALAGGRAGALLYAPFETELGGGAASTTVRAILTLDDQQLVAERAVTFTVPTDGAPILVAYASPDRALAGGDAAVTLVVEGRRLPSPEVTLSASPAVIDLPAALALHETTPGLWRGEVTVAAPPDPADVVVTVSAGDGVEAAAAVTFVAEGEPLFDLDGTFAQISYAVARIGDLVFLNPDPQCVVTPTLSLVTVEHDGAELALSYQTCDVEMPTVTVHFVGSSSTWVDPSFLAAMNERSDNPLVVALDGDGAGASLVVPPAALAVPLVVGAELHSASDALPTAEDDPRVRDHDGDGHPGVTLHNDTQGDQYAVYRTLVTSMTGAVESSHVVRGEVAADTESNILNGGGLRPTVTSLPSPYFLRRVDGRGGAPDIAGRDGDASSISCADVIGFKAELMSEAPPPSTATACGP